MWMMGYNEPHHEDHLNMNMVDSYTNNGTRKLRPLAPRPPPPSPTCATTSSSNRFHSTPHDHLHHLNHHHHHLVEQNKSREFNSQQMVVVSSRWNPTPEQLQTLEELYRRGTRTPSADEIQHITAQLRRFGKIEGKNVFYWFQNHKARERQKRRRQLDNKSTTNHDHIHQPTTFFSTDINHLDQPIQQKNFDVEETRNWAIPTFSEKNVLRERTGKSESMMTSIVDAAGNHQTTWIPVEQQEEEDQRNDQNVLLLHRRRKSFPATWNNIIQSSSSSSFPTNNHIATLINSTTCCTTPFPSTSKTTSSLVISSHANRHDDLDESYETLELFPVNREVQPEKCFSNPRSDHHVSSLSPRRQFIEFLPLKN